VGGQSGQDRELPEDLTILGNRFLKVGEGEIDVDWLIVMAFLGSNWLSVTISIKGTGMA
jgi:hypothetical protein